MHKEYPATTRGGSTHYRPYGFPAVLVPYDDKQKSTTEVTFNLDDLVEVFFNNMSDVRVHSIFKKDLLDVAETSRVLEIVDWPDWEVVGA